MTCKYPIVLVHGITFKTAYRRIYKHLKKQGYNVFNADCDAFGSIENNAAQIKDYIEKLLKSENAEKVNLIGHSKGGLDCRYMIDFLGMEERVASLTTVCTPHRGTKLADRIYGLPNPLKKFIAFFVNLWYRICRDKHPDVLQVCNQLQSIPESDETVLRVSPAVYCQSYSTTMKKSSDDFIMGIPYIYLKRFEKEMTDGAVAVSSTVYGNYKGECVDGSFSHMQTLGLEAGRKKRKKVYAFYRQLCTELAEMGF